MLLGSGFVFILTQIIGRGILQGIGSVSFSKKIQKKALNVTAINKNKTNNK